MAFKARLGPADLGNQRRGERTRVDIDGDLRMPAIADFAVRILDISTDGFLAECEAPFAPGSPLRLTLIGIGIFDTSVIWQRSGKLGCVFASPISESFRQAILRAGATGIE